MKAKQKNRNILLLFISMFVVTAYIEFGVYNIYYNHASQFEAKIVCAIAFNVIFILIVTAAILETIKK